MAGSALTASQRRHFATLLRNRRSDVAHHLEMLRATMSQVQAARSGAVADDEHDPEGPTMSQEWSSTTGLVADAEDSVTTIDKALERIDDGSYGRCVRCGGPIGVGRLDARPATELCIDCARRAQ